MFDTTSLIEIALGLVYVLKTLEIGAINVDAAIAVAKISRKWIDRDVYMLP